MVEDIKLVRIPKEAGAYLLKINEEVIYVGSSNNLYRRMVSHRRCIRQGSSHGYKQDLYQCLQLNPFTVEFQITDNYRQLEQELVEKYNPRYNSHRAYTGLGARKGRVNEDEEERYQKYKKELKQYLNQYNNQICCFNNEVLTLATLSMRFIKAGISHPTQEAKKYLIGGNDD